MSAPNDGGPAFPVLQVTTTEEGPFVRGASGMSLRDYFAAKAMEAWVSTFAHSRHPAENGGADDVARSSYALADAMLRAREVKS